MRILSPDQVGRYQVFFLYVMLFPGLFLTAGLTNGLYHWVGKYPESKPEVRQSWTLLVAITLAACAIGLMFARRFAPLLKIPVIELQAILLATPFVLGSAFLEDLMIARGNVWTGSLYASGFNLFKSASILFVAWWTHSVLWVFWFFVGSIACRAGVGWLLLSRTGEIKFIFSREKAAHVLRYAMPVSLAALGGLALANVDQMILSFRLSPAKFAFYALGCLSIPPLDIFESSVNRILIPRLSKAFASKDHVEARALFSEAVSELFRFLLPATIGLMIYAQPIIWVLFTQRYIAAAHYLRIYALIYVFWSFPFDAVARARGDGGWILRMSLVFAPLSILATWIATGRWSAMGALIAVLVAKCAMRVYSLSYDRRWLAASYAKFLPLTDMGIQAALALIAAAVSLLLRPLYADSRMWFLFTGPLFTLLYFGGTYAIDLRRLYANLGPIRVLELTQTLGLGGLERTVYLLSEMLNKRWRFNVLVASYEHPEGQPSLAPQFAEAGIPLDQWQKGMGFSAWSVFHLVRLIFSKRIRVLHVHDLGPLIYGSLAKFFSLGRVRLVLTLHTLLDIEQNPRYRFYYRVFLHFPDHIIAVSPGIKSGLLAFGVDARRIDVIPNGAAFSLSCLAPGAPLGKTGRPRADHARAGSGSLLQPLDPLPGAASCGKGTGRRARCLARPAEGSPRRTRLILRRAGNPARIPRLPSAEDSGDVPIRNASSSPPRRSARTSGSGPPISSSPGPGSKACRSRLSRRPDRACRRS